MSSERLDILKELTNLSLDDQVPAKAYLEDLFQEQFFLDDPCAWLDRAEEQGDAAGVCKVPPGLVSSILGVLRKFYPRRAEQPHSRLRDRYCLYCLEEEAKEVKEAKI